MKVKIKNPKTDHPVKLIKGPPGNYLVKCLSCGALNLSTQLTSTVASWTLSTSG